MNIQPTIEQKTRYAQSIEALNRGDWALAQQLAMNLLRGIPPHAGVYFVAGVAARELLQIPLAIECLQNATRLNPSRADYIAQLARCYAQASEPGKAVACADRAAAQVDLDARTLDDLGLVYTHTHSYSKAAAMFARASAARPADARFRFNHATALIHAGNVEEAERELEACISIDPEYWKAYLSRAQLRKQARDDNHVKQLNGLLANAGDDPLAALCLNLALSKELEDLGEYHEALKHLIRGKATIAAKNGYSSANDAALFEAITETCPGPDASPAGFESDEPIFVIGMPRTGTTLIERILSSHSDVVSAGELHNFGVALKRASGSRTAPMLDIDTIRKSGKLDWRALGQAYLQSARPVSSQGRRFVDKLPHNFLYAGFIAAALPNAKIICLRRDPMDSCLSNFRQLFSLTSRNYDYSFDLLDTGRYFILFDRLISFLTKRFPGRILEVRYEDVVADQEASSRRLLEFCGLPWQDACLHFEKNEAPVATASALQVRSPIYSSSIKRWKRHEEDLRGLRQLLEAGGIEIED